MKEPRYVVDRLDEHGGVTESRNFQSYRQVAKAYPDNFSVYTCTEILGRKQAKMRMPGNGSKLKKYSNYRLRRYGQTLRT